MVEMSCSDNRGGPLVRLLCFDVALHGLTWNMMAEAINCRVSANRSQCSYLQSFKNLFKEVTAMIFFSDEHSIAMQDFERKVE